MLLEYNKPYKKYVDKNIDYLEKILKTINNV